MTVEMRVDPQQTDRRPDKARHPAPGADGDRVIAADDQREGTVFQRFADAIGKAPTKPGDPHDRRLTQRIEGKQGFTPIDERMMFEFMPGL